MTNSTFKHPSPGFRHPELHRRDLFITRYFSETRRRKIGKQTARLFADTGFRLIRQADNCIYPPDYEQLDIALLKLLEAMDAYERLLDVNELEE